MFMNISISFKKYLIVGLALTILIAAGGMLFNRLLIENNSQVITTVKSINHNTNNLIDQYFTNAIQYMQSRQYEQAVAEWHKILLLQPDIPEVQVNLGFSLFELGRYEAAREFFISTIDHYAFQANAYYGLAIASEKLGDIEAAMGAMRSYIHLAAGDETFIRKARSALWEWESQLKSAKKTDITEDLKKP